jgi:hypothetical protein
MKSYLIGNCIYLPFTNSNGKNTKYVAGSVSGCLFLNDIYTEEELKAKWGNELKEFDSLTDIKEVWNK